MAVLGLSCSTQYFLFFYFFFLVVARGIYFSGKVKPGLPALGMQNLNHWTTREVPIIVFFFFKSQIMHLIV